MLNEKCNKNFYICDYRKFNSVINLVMNFLFPPICGSCGKFNSEYLCENCRARIMRLAVDRHKMYSNKYFTSHFWMFNYDDEIRSKMIDYKFNEKSYLYNFFVELVIKDNEAMQYIQQYDCIIPVPIHRKRKKKRGYNQSELIAKAISKKLSGLIYMNDILIKEKNIKPQSKLNEYQRKLNVQGVYKVQNLEKIIGKKVLVFDDVYTTGSTVNECCRMLKNSGCEEIGVFTICGA